ncbi:hypothetical protein P8605_48945, partial [Streptomyces sp. T-3]|nr:hypothetical protein [Streptomyces sp. T-3]
APDPAAPHDKRAGQDRDTTAQHPAKQRAAGPDSPYAPTDWRTTTAASWYSGGQDGHDTVGVARHGNTPFPSHAPQQAPGLAAQSASDGGSQRHGDPKAVSLSRAGALRLVPGGRAPATYHPVRDRHRDILEFPG